jgi:hypothetical protein
MADRPRIKLIIARLGKKFLALMVSEGSHLCSQKLASSPLVLIRNRCTSVSIVTRLRVGRLGFDSPQGQRVFFFFYATASRLALGPTQPPLQLVPGVKRPGREADHSPPSNTAVKNAWNVPPPQFLMVWCSIKQ